MHRYERWRRLIAEARDEGRVNSIIRDYVASLMPSEVARLPVSSQQALGNANADIVGSAFTLRRDELHAVAESEAAELLHELSLTLGAASQRISQIKSRATMPGPAGETGAAPDSAA